MFERKLNFPGPCSERALGLLQFRWHLQWAPEWLQATGSWQWSGNSTPQERCASAPAEHSLPKNTAQGLSASWPWGMAEQQGELRSSYLVAPTPRQKKCTVRSLPAQQGPCAQPAPVLALCFIYVQAPQMAAALPCALSQLLCPLTPWFLTCSSWFACWWMRGFCLSLDFPYGTEEPAATAPRPAVGSPGAPRRPWQRGSSLRAASRPLVTESFVG